MKSFIHSLIIALPFTGLMSCTSEHYTGPTIRIETNYGDITAELYPEKAPQTVAAFLGNIDSGVYKNSNFYRVLKEEDQPSSADKSNLIQGGINYTNYQFLKRQPGVPLETTKATGLLHEAGTISLARSAANSGRTEFFICLDKLPSYDFGGNGNPDKQGFAAFGKVIKGMKVVREIHKQPSTGDSFDKRILIKNIIFLNPEILKK